MSYFGLNFINQPLYGGGLFGSQSFMSPITPNFGTFNSWMPSIFGNFGTQSLWSGLGMFGGTDSLSFTQPFNCAYILPQTQMFPNIFSSSMPTFTMPSFTTPSISSSYSGNMFGFLTASSKKSSSSTSTTSKKTSRIFNTNSNLPSLKDVGYDKDKAQRLASEIAAVSRKGGFDGKCAKHVKEAIQDAGLGAYVSGHGYQMAGILNNNKNFKEIKVSSAEDLKKLPAGCILVYGRGVSGYNKSYGHTEITLGNGTAASGGITHNIRAGARVYVPV